MLKKLSGQMAGVQRQSCEDKCERVRGDRQRLYLKSGFKP